METVILLKDVRGEDRSHEAAGNLRPWGVTTGSAAGERQTDTLCGESKGIELI